LRINSLSAIAKEAYIYAFPIADGYRIEYAYFIDKNNPKSKLELIS